MRTTKRAATRWLLSLLLTVGAWCVLTSAMPPEDVFISDGTVITEDTDYSGQMVFISGRCTVEKGVTLTAMDLQIRSSGELHNYGKVEVNGRVNNSGTCYNYEGEFVFVYWQGANPIEVDPNTHTWTVWEVLEEPTAALYGTMRRACPGDDKHAAHTELKVLPKLYDPAAEPTPYNGTPQTPQRITADNYADYGLTASNWTVFEGYYGIRTAEELRGFMNLAIGITLSEKGVLTENVRINALGSTTHEWPLRYLENNGVFDGTGHTVAGIYSVNRGYNGLFSIVDAGAIVRNVGVKDVNCPSGSYVGGITGLCSGTIDNCFVVDATLNGTYAAGGICGYARGTVTNCYAVGHVNSKWGVALAVDITDSNSTVENVYGAATVAELEGAATGALTHALNGHRQQRPVAWYQKLGADGDALPVLYGTQSTMVYGAYEHCTCGGEPYGTPTAYANDPIGNPTPDPHNFILNVSADADGLYGYTCNACGTANATDKEVHGFNVDGDMLPLHMNEDGTFMTDIMQLSDAGYYRVPVDVTVNQLTYERQFAHTHWQALYVPFDIPFDVISDDCDVSVINNMHQYDDNEDGNYERTELEVLRLTPGQIIMANMPYLIRPKRDGVQTINLYDVTVKAAATGMVDCASVNYTYVFTGTYDGISGAAMYDNNLYALANGALCRATTVDAALGAFRWFMKATPRLGYGSSGSALPSPRIVVIETDSQGNTTGISTIEGETTVNSAIYGLDGRCMPPVRHNLPKGIYIINGKKVVK